MRHIYFNAISDHHNEYLNSLRDVEPTVTNWNNEGDSNIHVFQITISEDAEADAVLRDKQEIALDIIMIH
ncbi:MAG: hypothetical protein JEY94_17420 [Melioribacteraceae bacterium]|nr:hypothetical protein [Melioribacteraceae bacterium]